jgi:hypothetical protein
MLSQSLEIFPDAVANIIGLYASLCTICFAPFVSYRNRCVSCNFETDGVSTAKLSRKSLWQQTEPAYDNMQVFGQFDSTCLELGHARRVWQVVPCATSTCLTLMPCKKCAKTTDIYVQIATLDGRKWRGLDTKVWKKTVGADQRISCADVSCVLLKTFRVEVPISEIKVAGIYVVFLEGRLKPFNWMHKFTIELENSRMSDFEPRRHTVLACDLDMFKTTAILEEGTRSLSFVINSLTAPTFTIANMYCSLLLQSIN